MKYLHRVEINVENKRLRDWVFIVILRSVDLESDEEMVLMDIHVHVA